jgi:hypothetical protein
MTADEYRFNGQIVEVSDTIQGVWFGEIHRTVIGFCGTNYHEIRPIGELTAIRIHESQVKFI